MAKPPAMPKAEPQATPPFPAPALDERGIDRSQIHAMLRLTPSERLRHLESVLASLAKLRAAYNAPTP